MCDMLNDLPRSYFLAQTDFQQRYQGKESIVQTLKNESEQLKQDEQHFGRKLHPAERFKDRLIIEHFRKKTNKDLFEVDEHTTKSQHYEARSKHG